MAMHNPLWIGRTEYRLSSIKALAVQESPWGQSTLAWESIIYWMPQGLLFYAECLSVCTSPRVRGCPGVTEHPSQMWSSLTGWDQTRE